MYNATLKGIGENLHYVTWHTFVSSTPREGWEANYQPIKSDVFHWYHVNTDIYLKVLRIKHRLNTVTCVFVEQSDYSFNTISVNIMAVSFIGGNPRISQSCRPELVASNWQTLSHIVGCSEYTSPWAGFKLTTFMLIGTDYIGYCKSNYHMIRTTSAPVQQRAIVI